ncbi:MAG: hypothetical protein JWO56_2020 [Acidobacteria bacterium]|nr:hypothetical protein [Acidobacteriota bacterium]
MNVPRWNILSGQPNSPTTSLEWKTTRRIAGQLDTSVDDALTRELEARASACSEELATSIPGFAAALAWPERTVEPTPSHRRQ